MASKEQSYKKWGGGLTRLSKLRGLKVGLRNVIGLHLAGKLPIQGVKGGGRLAF